MNEEELIIQRPVEVQKQLGISHTTYHVRIDQGLIPKSFSLGSRAVGHLLHETNAIIAAMAAELSDREIKALVVSLMDKRKLLLNNIVSTLPLALK